MDPFPSHNNIGNLWQPRNQVGLSPWNSTTSGHPPVFERTFDSVSQVARDLRLDGNTSDPTQESTIAKPFFRTLAFFGGCGLGILTGLAVIGITSTPVGWGVVGAIFLLGIMGYAYYGGTEELLEALKIAALGFIVVLQQVILMSLSERDP